MHTQEQGTCQHCGDPVHLVDGAWDHVDQAVDRPFGPHAAIPAGRAVEIELEDGSTAYYGI